MCSVHRIARGSAALAACLLVTLGVSGCDAGDDPLAVVVAEETRGALALNMGLPSLPEMAREAGVEDRLEAVLDRWTASWGRPAGQGRALREDAYDEALPALLESLGPDRIEDELARLLRATDAAADLPESTLTPELRARIEEATALAHQGRDALAEGRSGDALRRTVTGADVFREIGPRSVALYLIDRADAALDRARSEGITGSERDARRGSRMILGAREALERKDYPLAIRRAYYACHLLGLEIDL